MTTIKDLANKGNLFTQGHRACAGCGGTVILRLLMAAAGKDTVVVGATGCMEVVSTIYPYTAWNVPFLHNAFENSAATASGVESAYRALLKRKKTDKKINFIAFGGDGGTYDIGIQSLSGAMERGHNLLYVCYDNGAYMNTGIQRSSATPMGSSTTTSPAGSVVKGKMQNRKDLTEIMVAHNLKYAAQASLSNWSDFVSKVEKALAVDGPTFINVLSPCPLGWGYDTSLSIELSRLAVETHFWPVYEYEDGKYKINIKPKQVKPLEDFLFKQARFKHLKNEPELVEEIKKSVEEKWNCLLQKESSCK
jgi:pyruvate ferredoxin oxidoreductase beta subunit